MLLKKLLTIAFAFLLTLSLTLQTSAEARPNFNVGVGLSGSNSLTFSTDTPGYFKYNLILRTSAGSDTGINTDYSNSSNNFSRTVKLECSTGETSASNDPSNGTCLANGPFVRGVFLAGNDNEYAIVKKFTLFCGSIQIAGEAKTQNWNEEFYNNEVRSFLSSGPTSPTCPTATPVPSASPTPTSKLAKATPTDVVDEDEEMSEEVQEITPTETAEESGSQNNALPLILGIGGIVLASIATVLGYKNKDKIMQKFTSFKKSSPEIKKIGTKDLLNDEIDSSTKKTDVSK